MMLPRRFRSEANRGTTEGIATEGPVQNPAATTRFHVRSALGDPASNPTIQSIASRGAGDATGPLALAATLS